MSNLTENAVWESGIYQLETTDPVLGGEPNFVDGSPAEGHANAQAQQLANRTNYLKQRIDEDLANATDPAKGAAMVGYRSPLAGAVGRALSEKLGDTISVKDFGVSPSASASTNREAMQAAIDYATANGMTLDFSFPTDIPVDNTIFFHSNTKIANRGVGGIVRTTLTPDADGKIAVLSAGDSGAFKSNVRITGGLKIQFSAGLVGGNRRGAGTACFYAENLHTSHLELRCMYGEYAWLGKSNFNITGVLDAEWCHKGLYLDPLVAGSAGAACTSFDLRVNMDFVIFPFTLTKVVYSRFTGFCETIRQSYDHYEADEMSVIFTLDGCLSCSFDQIGVEAFQGMLIYNKAGGSYVKFSLQVDLSNTDKFQHIASRINNVPYAEQALISLQGVGTYDFDQTAISGSSVTVSTDNSYFIRRGSDNAIMNINGGFIEPGANYILADRTQGIHSSGSRLFNAYRYTNTESRINMASGLVWIDLGELLTNAAGEVTVAPTGIKQLLMVNAYVIRGTASTANVANIKSKNTPVNWTLITGLGAAGYGVDVKVLAIAN